MAAAERRRPPTSGSVPSDDELAALISEIRARNLSRAHGPLLPGVDALAAPVFDYRDKLIAVICVVGRAGAMNGNWDGPVVKSLITAAGDLSRQLGHVDHKRGPEAAPAMHPKAGKSARRAARR
jgi:DNA-binding IclR family transcriptional regulator